MGTAARPGRAQLGWRQVSERQWLEGPGEHSHTNTRSEFPLVPRRDRGITEFDQLSGRIFGGRKGSARVGVDDSQNFPAANTPDRQALAFNRDDAVFFVENFGLPGLHT